MNERAQLIKQAMALELEKEGMRIEDLEAELTKQAAGMSLLDFGKLTSLFGSGFNLAGATALGAGGLVGAGAYGGYLANEDSNNKQLKKMKEMQQYHDATNSLKEDMQHPITL
jgi:hypothetical protein